MNDISKDYKERLQYLIGILANGKKANFARMLGKSKSMVTEVMQGKRKLSRSSNQTLCRDYGVNINWLEYGTGITFIYKTENIGESTKILETSKMSIREYYIGKALGGLCARQFPENMKENWVEWASELAIELTDETLKRLNQETN